MDTGYYKFYRDKKLLLVASLPLLGCCVAEIYSNTSDVWGFCLFSLFFFFFIFWGWFRKPYIETTSSYIQINYCVKLKWSDVERVTKTTGRGGAIYHLWPKDISKYHLTMFQKIMMKNNYSPFYIQPVMLQERELRKLQKILRERVPNNNLEEK